MDADTRRSTLVALFALLAASSVALAGVGQVGGSHGAENGNYTVSIPGSEDRSPGASGVTVHHLAAVTAEAFDRAGATDEVDMDYIVVSSPDVDFSDCTTEDTRAFGIDRGNDDAGTRTDEDLLQHRKDSQFRSNSIVVEFFDGDELAAPDDSPPTLFPGDEIVAAQDSCYGMPDDPGWYQIHGFMNGTDAEGRHVESDMPSHYFWVCDCEDEQEARNELGPPPSDDGGDGSAGGSDGGDGSGNGDGSAGTRTATEAAGGGSDGDGTGSSGGDGSSDGSTGGSGNDGAGTGGGGDGDAGGGDGATGTGPTTTADSGSGSGGDGDAGGTGDGGGGVQTPSPGDGPGFGTAAALVALAGAALLAARRS